MVFCQNCGVELEEGIEVCPLCGRIPGNSQTDEIIIRNTPGEILALQRKENRRSLWELAGIIAFSGVTVCTVIDFLAGEGVGWSLYTDVILPGIWLILTFLLFLNSKPLIMITGTAFTTLAVLAGIDLISAGHDWFMPIGLPVTLVSFSATAVLFILYEKAGFKGLNIIGAGSILAALICIVTELSVDLYIKGAVNLRWSLYVTVSTLPVSVILFYCHYRLKRGDRLDSLFHI